MHLTEKVVPHIFINIKEIYLLLPDDLLLWDDLILTWWPTFTRS